jgi:hypothetical protein
LGSIWSICFRREDFSNISQSETRIALGDHICWWNGTKWRNFIEDLTSMLTAKMAGSIYLRSSIKLLYLVPFGQETWLLLQKIEHMVKLHVFGNT